ncbi:MAG: hypothetical protein NT062_32950 [Proteobacteria bacterium]|nr:hypothetical protein [Pseudomonadota bacterium]
MTTLPDIDALLIGALYGELTPADEARLSAHLDAHPTDQRALDGLRITREAVRESRILAISLDPPQAISAVLLQEAARRAPKFVPHREQQEGGWFTRFVRSFAAHPAMAAAAMLVMVVGVGGLLYMKNGANQFATSTVDEATVATQATATSPRAPAPSASAGSGFVFNDEGAKQDVAKEAAKEADSYRVDLADDSLRRDNAPQGIVVHTPEPMVKDLDAKLEAKPRPTATPPTDALAMSAPKKMAPKAKEESKGMADAKTSTAASNARGDEIASTDPQAPGGVAVGGAAGAAAPVQTPDKNMAQRSEPSKVVKADSSLVAWAQDQHARVSALVKAGNCPDAAKLASTIATRAPEYYNQAIATDRALKQCSAYFSAEREKAAESSNKARAQKRLDANEPSPAPSK